MTASVWGLVLTVEMARKVRAWRVDREGTWRGVAAMADDAWDAGTGGNQLFGRDLCEASARLLGEDPDIAPWN
jgi:hypothetical protein